MEIWKDIKDFEGYYQVSNLGNVKSLDRKSETNGRIRNIKGRILKQSTNPKGYKLVFLCKAGIISPINVHRLVCLAFIKNTFCKGDVNHKNGIKSDNNVDNLEWLTRSENVKHAFDNGLNYVSEVRKLKFLLIAKDNSRKVIDINSGKIYKSAKEASINFGIKYVTLHAQLSGRNNHKTTLRYL